MYTVCYVSPQYSEEGNQFIEIGREEDLDAIYEVIRSYLLEKNSAIMSNEAAPEACRKAAERNVKHNEHLTFHKLISGIVLIDEELPDCDFYHIARVQ